MIADSHPTASCHYALPQIAALLNPPLFFPLLFPHTGFLAPRFDLIYFPPKVSFCWDCWSFYWNGCQVWPCCPLFDGLCFILQCAVCMWNCFPTFSEVDKSSGRIENWGQLLESFVRFLSRAGNVRCTNVFKTPHWPWSWCRSILEQLEVFASDRLFWHLTTVRHHPNKHKPTKHTL